jgi:hypothetical protein
MVDVKEVLAEDNILLKNTNRIRTIKNRNPTCRDELPASSMDEVSKEYIEYLEHDYYVDKELYNDIKRNL